MVPGLELTAKMEFFAFDAFIPAGHELELLLASTGRDYPPSVVTQPVMVDMDATEFKVPLIERDDEVFFRVPGDSG